MENGPPGPNRKTLVLEYCEKMQGEVAGIFENKFLSEIELQKTLTQDQVQKLESQVSELKEEHRAEINAISTKIRFLEAEKAELSAKEQALRENYNSTIKEKDSIQRELEERLSEEKKQLERIIKMMHDKMSHQEDQVRTAQEKVLTIESDSNKQQALNEQKISYLEKALEEAKNKERGYGCELKNAKKDYMNGMKETISKYENQIKELQNKLDLSKDQIGELEAKIAEMQQSHENERLQLSEECASEKFKYEESAKTISDMKERISLLNSRIKSQQKAMEISFNKERGEFQTKIADRKSVV